MDIALGIRSMPAGNPVTYRAAAGPITAVLAAMAMVVTDAAMMNLALPTIAKAFEITAARSVQVVTAYQIAIVMFLLPCAAVGEALGLRKVFCAGLLTFAIASGLAASASTFPVLVAARFVQGIGAAAIMALGVALLRQALPEAKLATAIGWNAVTVAVCSAAGPMISAAILTAGSWPALFLVHLPLGAVALASSRAFPADNGTGRSIDVVGATLSAAGFCALFVGLGAAGAATFVPAILIGGSVVCFSLIARRSRARPSPVIPFDLLGQRKFRLAIIASVCCFIAQTAGLLAIPFHLQATLGLTPLMAGLYLTPWPAAVALAAITAARILQRYPHAPVAPAGTAILAAGLAAAAAAVSTPDPLVLVPITAICGVGFGFFQVANNRILYLSAPAERTAAAGGLQGTARLMGQANGAIVVALLFDLVPLASAPRFALAVGSVLAVVSALVSRQHRALKKPHSVIH